MFQLSQAPKVEDANTRSVTRLEGIESLRAYAAISIILFHMSGVAHVPIPAPLDFIKSHFGMGVPLFFVVSAFSLAYGYLGKLKTEEAFRHYFIRRLARIAPLFYAMLAFELSRLWIISRVTHPALDILLNLVFAFNFIPHLTDGIVMASWSIGVEMIFYVLFPFFLCFCTTFMRTLFLVLISILITTKFSADMKDVMATMPSFINHNFIINLPYFCLGLLAFHGLQAIKFLRLDTFSKIMSWVLSGCALGIIVLLYKDTELYMYFMNKGHIVTWATLWGIPFGLLCVGMALHPIALISNFFSRYMGRISYSLYLAHPTIVYYLGKIGVYQYIYDLMPTHDMRAFALSVIATLGVVGSVATLMYRYIETPGMALGKRLCQLRVSTTSKPREFNALR